MDKSEPKFAANSNVFNTPKNKQGIKVPNTAAHNASVESARLQLAASKRPRRGQLDTNGFKSFLANPTAGTKEIITRVTDFYSSTAAHSFTQYYFDVDNNNAVNPSTQGSNHNLSKVIGATFYALPAFSMSTSNSAVMVLFGTTVQVSEDSDALKNNATHYTAAAQQATTLTPTSVSKWVKVGSWRADSLFKDSNVRAAMLNNLFICGNTMAVTPDTGLASPIPVQYMVQIDYAQTLPNLAEIYGMVPVVTTPQWSGILNAGSPSISQAAMVEFKRIQRRV